MNDLRDFLNSISPDEQRAFAERAGTSVGYLRKAISAGQSIGVELAVRLAHQSRGRLTVDAVRPDVDWALIQSAPTRANSQDALLGK